MGRLLVFLVAVLWIGCARTAAPPKTAAELRDAAIAACEEAREADDAAQALQAAKRAEEAAAEAARLVETPEATVADQATSEEAAAAAREARAIADLKREEKELAEIVTGWKAKTYSGARKLAIAAAFKGLSLAADQAAKTDPASLPESVRESADLAAKFAGQFAHRKPLADGRPDWPGIATDLDAFGSQPPPEIAMVAALGCVLSGRSRLALYELETVDPESLESRDLRACYHVLRGVVLSQNDLRRLSLRELKKAEELTAGEQGAAYGPQMLAGVHLLLARSYLSDRQLRQADLELVRAMQAWPNNPVAVYLTGERLAADGRYEEAAESLEKACQGTNHAPLAEKVARRARELRDRGEKAEPLLTDTGFLCDLAVHFIAEAAKESPTARRIEESMATARQFGRRMLQQLPGGGEENQ